MEIAQNASFARKVTQEIDEMTAMRNQRTLEENQIRATVVLEQKIQGKKKLEERKIKLKEDSISTYNSKLQQYADLNIDKITRLNGLES